MKKSITEHIAGIKAAACQLNALLCAAEDDGYEIYDGANGLGRALDFSLTVKVGPDQQTE